MSDIQSFIFHVWVFLRNQRKSWRENSDFSFIFNFERTSKVSKDEVDGQFFEKIMSGFLEEFEKKLKREFYVEIQKTKTICESVDEEIISFRVQFWAKFVKLVFVFSESWFFSNEETNQFYVFRFLSFYSIFIF